ITTNAVSTDSNPAADAAIPERRPRRVFETVFPSTSLIATEQTPRERLKTISANTTDHPTALPSSIAIAASIAISAKACPTLPATQNHLRIGCCRICCATNNCGNNANDSRIGTKAPINALDAPRSEEHTSELQSREK